MTTYPNKDIMAFLQLISLIVMSILVGVAIEQLFSYCLDEKDKTTSVKKPGPISRVGLLYCNALSDYLLCKYIIELQKINYCFINDQRCQISQKIEKSFKSRQAWGMNYKSTPPCLER